MSCRLLAVRASSFIKELLKTRAVNVNIVFRFKCQIAEGASSYFLYLPVNFPIAKKIGNRIDLTGLGITSMSISDLYFVNRKAASNGLGLSSLALLADW